MPFRTTAALLAVFAVVPATSMTGCTWDNRPDGGTPLHTDSRPDPLTRPHDQTEVVEPLDATDAARPDAMPMAPGAPPVAPDAAGTPPSGSASGDGAATGPGAPALGTSGNPAPR